MRRLMLAAVVLCLCPVARADEYTVENLLKRCEVGSSDYGYCEGLFVAASYVMGTNGGFTALHLIPRDVTLLSLCSNGHMPTIGAQIQAFKNWANAHPESWGITDVIGVGAALHQTWPCASD